MKKPSGGLTREEQDIPQTPAPCERCAGKLVVESTDTLRFQIVSDGKDGAGAQAKREQTSANIERSDSSLELQEVRGQARVFAAMHEIAHLKKGDGAVWSLIQSFMLEVSNRLREGEKK